jgi:hypothetical protein
MASWRRAAIPALLYSPEQQSFEIIDQIGHADFHFSAGDPNGTDEQPHPIFLLSKDILDARVDFRLGGIGAANREGHGSAFGLFAMNAANKTVLLHERLVGRGAIGRIRPNIRRRVALVEQTFAQARARLGSGVACGPFADEVEAAVD